MFYYDFYSVVFIIHFIIIINFFSFFFGGWGGVGGGGWGGGGYISPFLPLEYLSGNPTQLTVLRPCCSSHFNLYSSVFKKLSVGYVK